MSPRAPLRLALVVGALFTALTVLGGTGLVLRTIASVDIEHGHQGSTLHEDDGDGAVPSTSDLSSQSSR